MDPFAALGLDPTANAEAVKAAYRDRARSLHPDAGGSAEEFEALNENYRAALHKASTRPCPTCQGKGTLTKRKGWDTLTTTCHACKGRKR